MPNIITLDRAAWEDAKIPVNQPGPRRPGPRAGAGRTGLSRSSCRATAGRSTARRPSRSRGGRPRQPREAGIPASRAPPGRGRCRSARQGKFHKGRNKASGDPRIEVPLPGVTQPSVVAAQRGRSPARSQPRAVAAQRGRSPARSQPRAVAAPRGRSPARSQPRAVAAPRGRSPARSQPSAVAARGDAAPCAASRSPGRNHRAPPGRRYHRQFRVQSRPSPGNGRRPVHEPNLRLNCPP
jgi:hypothetical protein